MKDREEPYRHEIKSKLKTQVVKEKQKREQRKYIIEMMKDDEELDIYNIKEWL